MKNKALLFKALDSIHKEPESFDMGWFAFDGSDSTPYELIMAPTCHTTMCLAGWVLHHYAQEGGLLTRGAYSSQALNALGVSSARREWGSLLGIMLLDKHPTPKTPSELVAQLELYDILAEGEYVYVE